MSAHTHTEFVPGCFRCDLSRIESEPPYFCGLHDAGVLGARCDCPPVLPAAAATEGDTP